MNKQDEKNKSGARKDSEESDRESGKSQLSEIREDEKEFPTGSSKVTESRRNSSSKQQSDTSNTYYKSQAK